MSSIWFIPVANHPSTALWPALLPLASPSRPPSPRSFSSLLRFAWPGRRIVGRAWTWAWQPVLARRLLRYWRRLRSICATRLQIWRVVLFLETISRVPQDLVLGLSPSVAGRLEGPRLREPPLPKLGRRGVSAHPQLCHAAAHQSTAAFECSPQPAQAMFRCRCSPVPGKARLQGTHYEHGNHKDAWDWLAA